MDERERLKSAFLSADKADENYVYTPSQLRALCEMAKEGVIPDGRFGDTDCMVWGMFRECLHKGNADANWAYS